ncbi:MAG: nitrilase-related carbon-nitrogen hydrolase [Promethearchaeota archaeon]
MRVGYLQYNPDFGEKEVNFRKIQKLLKNVSTDLLVLPELFATGYTFISKQETHDMAEKIGEETTTFLQNLAKDTGGIIVGGIALKKQDKVYNAAIVVNDEEILGTYEKVHLFNKEKLWFSPGDEGFKVFDIGSWKLGVMICWDWIFPESSRTLALMGAEVIAHPTNLVLPYCQKAMTTRCIENHIFAITANRYGIEERGEDKFEFGGHSQITDPWGKVLASGPKAKDSVEVVDIDPELSRDKKLTPLNDLFSDRREKLYFRESTN